MENSLISNSKSLGMENGHQACFGSPFLQLPLELREMIYSYLVPDKSVAIFESFSHAPPSKTFRNDGTACSAAMLRVNRQCHHEMVPLFYGTAVFAMYVEPDEISFLSQPIYAYEPVVFPSTLCYVKRLHITVKVTLYYTSTRGGGPNKAAKVLVQHLSQNCPRLKSIVLSFELYQAEYLSRERQDWYRHEHHAFLRQLVRPSLEWAIEQFLALDTIPIETGSKSIWNETFDQNTPDSTDPLLKESERWCREQANSRFQPGLAKMSDRRRLLYE
jgi:hypothetical protein